MATNDTATSVWSRPRKATHWLVVFLVLFEVPIGYLMSYTYGPGMRDEKIGALHRLASQFHHTAGYGLLLLGIAWLVMRLRTPRPPLPPGTSPLQSRLTLAVQAGLGLLLIAIPWSGWTALSALADSPTYGPTHMWLFGADRVLPRIWKPLPFDAPLGYRLFGTMHVYLIYTAGAILLVHALAALWHHNVRRNDVFVRMWPFGTPRSRS